MTDTLPSPAPTLQRRRVPKRRRRARRERRRVRRRKRSPRSRARRRRVRRLAHRTPPPHRDWHRYHKHVLFTLVLPDLPVTPSPHPTIISRKRMYSHQSCSRMHHPRTQGTTQSHARSKGLESQSHIHNYYPSCTYVTPCLDPHVDRIKETAAFRKATTCRRVDRQALPGTSNPGDRETLPLLSPHVRESRTVIHGVRCCLRFSLPASPPSSPHRWVRVLTDV